MENNEVRQPQDDNMLITDTSNKNEEKQIEAQQRLNKNSKKRLWIVIGITTGVIAAVGVIVGALAINGTFSGDSCPAGEYRVCGPLANGEEACGCHSSPNVVLKPIIYLYPEKETEITVRLGEPENLTSSYPEYTDGWDVVAYPDGTLNNKTTGTKLYSLYWEGIKDCSNLNKTIGFMIKGADSAEFLEDKLEVLGLNYKEKEEFIVYWLPKLESHNYNYIYFATEEEIEREMPLELSVKPDTIIRVRMLFEGLDEYKEVEEQLLIPAPERNGFTVVEWGGTDLTKQDN